MEHRSISQDHCKNRKNMSISDPKESSHSYFNVATVPFTINLTGSRHIALITTEGLSVRKKKEIQK